MTRFQKDISKMSKRELRNDLGLLRRDIARSAGLKCPQAHCHDTGDYWTETNFLPVPCEFCRETPDSIFERDQDPTPDEEGEPPITWREYAAQIKPR